MNLSFKPRNDFVPQDHWKYRINKSDLTSATVSEVIDWIDRLMNCTYESWKIFDRIDVS